MGKKYTVEAQYFAKLYLPDEPEIKDYFGNEKEVVVSLGITTDTVWIFTMDNLKKFGEKLINLTPVDREPTSEEKILRRHFLGSSANIDLTMDEDKYCFEIPRVLMKECYDIAPKKLSATLRGEEYTFIEVSYK